MQQLHCGSLSKCLHVSERSCEGKGSIVSLLPSVSSSPPSQNIYVNEGSGLAGK
jgi:hypothetical protein